MGFEDTLPPLAEPPLLGFSRRFSEATMGELAVLAQASALIDEATAFLTSLDVEVIC